MDGIHDLGGKQGYGPVEVEEDETPFHADWEGREWGIAQSARTPGITIDWWRHCRELIMPVDYLARPYFDSWAQTDFATYIEAGWFTLEEVRAGKSLRDDVGSGNPAPAMSLAQVVQADHDNARRFDGETDAPPKFAPGQRVRTVKHGHAGHTRLPQYARDCIGAVHAHHGAHVYPDLSATGVEEYRHLYSVVFAASDLWPEAADSPDKVYLDLWQDYLLEEKV